MLSAPNSRDLSANECVEGSPIHLIADDRPPSTQSLSALVIRILGVRDGGAEKSRDNSIREDTEEICLPMNAQRVKGSPIHLIAGQRPPSTVDTILKCLDNQDPRGQRRRRREEPG
ncbi:hypothetical protein CEXT_544271 [Caerostris extrusa]|uniref:Uncharacterized protein n=1 Tax=Caerostris extrusa TaxID=172846 RepID=A0AAV4QA19_CAEEX|nr:hypothetical protein CEXT_544271 [Caerostris extrusa]